MNDSNNGLLGDISKWMAHPFNTQGSALNWILFVGLLFIAGWFWNYVLIKMLGTE